VKYAFIQAHLEHHSIVFLCEVLGTSTSGYYDWLKREPTRKQLEDSLLVHQIVAVHHETMDCYGSPRMHAELKATGAEVSLGRVERLMRVNGLAAKQGRKNQQRQQHKNANAPADNLLDRQFSADAVNKKWVSDITFIETREGFLYLAVILDLFSRAVIGWSMSQKIDEQLIQGALSMAVDRRRIGLDLLLHSDQGSQYKAEGYQQRMRDLGIICSMSRKGECHDNAVAESFFHSLKTELICDEVYASRAKARQEIFKYIEMFYNRKRRHSTLGYQAPYVYEMMHAA
jgi:putative transposase